MKKIIAIVSIVIALAATIGTVVAYKAGANLKIAERPYSAQYDKRNVNAATTVRIRTSVPTSPAVGCEMDDEFYHLYPVYHYGVDEMDRGFIILIAKDDTSFTNGWDEIFHNIRADLLGAEDVSAVLGYDITGSFVKASDYFDKDAIEEITPILKESIGNGCYSFGSSKIIDYSEADIYSPGTLFLLVDSEGLLGKQNTNRTLVFILIGITIVSALVFFVDFILLVMEDRRHSK